MNNGEPQTVERVDTLSEVVLAMEVQSQGEETEQTFEILKRLHPSLEDKTVTNALAGGLLLQTIARKYEAAAQAVIDMRQRVRAVGLALEDDQLWLEAKKELVDARDFIANYDKMEDKITMKAIKNIPLGLGVTFLLTMVPSLPPLIMLSGLGWSLYSIWLLESDTRKLEGVAREAAPLNLLGRGIGMTENKVFGLLDWLPNESRFHLRQELETLLQKEITIIEQVRARVGKEELLT